VTQPLAEGGPLPPANPAPTLLDLLEEHIRADAHNETGETGEYARRLLRLIDTYRQTHGDQVADLDQLGRRIVDLLQAHVSGYRHGGAGHLAHLVYLAAIGYPAQCTVETGPVHHANSRTDWHNPTQPERGTGPG
jgi:hypothetical protein